MKSKILIPVLLLAVLFIIPSQEAAETPEKTETSAAVTEKTPAEDKKAEKTIKEQREEKLLYGINSAVLELLKNLQEEKNSDFNEKLKDILADTKNRKVSENIIDLFMLTEDYSADETVFKFIEEKEYSGKNVVKKSIQYLSKTGKEKYNTAFKDLLDSADEVYRIEAVKALCKSGRKEYTSELMALYEEDDSDRLRTEILLNIGELKDSTSVDFLIDILDDDYIDKTSRQYACYSLGLIADDKSYPALLKAYEDTDPSLRSYALDALSKFSKDDTEEIMLQALKDDSWQIRKQAVLSAAELKNSAFVPFLIYMAVNDPAKPVRTQTVKSLAAIGSSKSLGFLREKAADKKAPLELRKLALIELINNDLSGSLSTIDRILEEEWELKTPMLLELACGTLAETESNQLTKYYERMLDHPTLTIKLSGLKGIKRNKCTSLKSKVEKFTEAKGSSSFKRYAQSVLEEL